MQVGSQISPSFSRVIPIKQISLQAQIAQKVENWYCFSYIIAEKRYHKENVSKCIKARFWM